jgi:hypothetical protein
VSTPRRKQSLKKPKEKKKRMVSFSEKLEIDSNNIDNSIDSLSINPLVLNSIQNNTSVPKNIKSKDSFMQQKESKQEIIKWYVNFFIFLSPFSWSPRFFELWKKKLLFELSPSRLPFSLAIFHKPL